jgi:hypothetical protein
MCFGALAAFLTNAAPSEAQAPTRTAWWNQAPFGLVVSPSAVRSDQLLVAEGAARPDATAAVLYSLGDGSQVDASPLSVSATMKLTLDTGSSVGTPAVMACPIIARAPWKSGGDQTGGPPAADCSNGRAVAGQLSADGASLVFALTPAQQSSAGVFNLALVPASQVPFQAVFDRPGNDSFAVTGPPVDSPAQGSYPASTSGGATGSSPPGTEGTAPSSGHLLAGQPAGRGGGDSGDGPIPPVVAPRAGAQTGGVPGGLPPSLSSSSTRSGGLMGGRRQQLLGVWLLVDAGLVLFLLGSEFEPPPRLLGSLGAYRSTEAADAKAAAGQELGGIGRFARPRTGPPARLS